MEVARDDARTAGALVEPKALTANDAELNLLAAAINLYSDAWEIVTDAPDASDWDMARGKVRAARQLFIEAAATILARPGK